MSIIDSDFEQKEFNDFIIQNGVVGFYASPVTLKSGRKSHWYVDWRKITEDAYLADRLAEYIIRYALSRDIKPDSFVGVPEGATKIGIVTQMMWAQQAHLVGGRPYAPGSYSLSMGRGKPKVRGPVENRYFLGFPEGKVVVIEDVTTTGGSLLNVISDIKELEGVESIVAFGLTNRREVTPIPGVDDEEKTVRPLGSRSCGPPRRQYHRCWQSSRRQVPRDCGKRSLLEQGREEIQ
jgi:orotate phosphoribosyltransferase